MSRKKKYKYRNNNIIFAIYFQLTMSDTQHIKIVYTERKFEKMYR